MSAPVISTRIPAVNATNVYLNQLIYITFDQPMTSSTLNDNTLLLYRTSDYTLLDKTISYDSTTYKVTVTPDVVFDKNTVYNMVVVGANQSTTCVKNSSSENLATSATWYFTTGEDVYEAPEDTITETQAEVEVADSPVVKVLEPRSSTSLAITDTSPDNYDTNLGTLNSDNATVTWAGPITITFNKAMASGTSVSQSWVSLSTEASDGDPSSATATPTGTLSNTYGKTLTYTITGNNASWRVNNEVIVTVSSNTEDGDGDTLDSDYQFMFTTRYFPYYCTVKKIRTVIGPFIRDVNDDAIARNIYLNSLEAYNIANEIYNQGVWDEDSPTFAAKMWTCCKTQYDLLHAKLLDMAAEGPGQMKRLGDFTIQENLNIKGVEGALQKALDCVNAWFKQILGKHRRAKAKMVIKGVTATTTPPMRGVRTWSVPNDSEGLGANKRGSRRVKSPGLYDEWS